MRVVLKVRRKGIIILPKRLREALDIDEGDEVVAEIVDDKLTLRPLRPRVVDIDPEVVEELLREERELEEDRLRRLISYGEAGSRR